MVRTRAAPAEMVVASWVSVTAWALILMGWASDRSVRRKMMPVSGGAWRRVSSTRAPLCSPTPVARVRDLMVRGASLGGVCSGVAAIVPVYLPPRAGAGVCVLFAQANY